LFRFPGDVPSSGPRRCHCATDGYTTSRGPTRGAADTGMVDLCARHPRAVAFAAMASTIFAMAGSSPRTAVASEAYKSGKYPTSICVGFIPRFSMRGCARWGRGKQSHKFTTATSWLDAMSGGPRLNHS